MSNPTIKLMATVTDYDVTDAEPMDTSDAAVAQFKPQRLTIEVEADGMTVATLSGPRMMDSGRRAVFMREFRTWYASPATDPLPPMSEAPQWVQDAVKELTK
jgi:hypothetical protein